MGTNVAREAVNDSAAIVNNAVFNATQTASTTFSASENITVQNCKDVDIENVDFSEFIIIDVREQLNAFFSNTDDTEIKRKISQVVKQIIGFLAITGSNEADIITTLVTSVVNNMKSTFSQVCAESLAVRQGVLCSNSDNVKIDGIKFSNYINNVNSCISNDVTVNTSATALFETVNQSADQLKRGFFAPFAWFFTLIGFIFFTILLIVIFGLITAGAIFGDPVIIFGFLFFSIGALSLLVSFGYFPQWWPYETETVLDTPQETKSKKKKNLILFIVSGVLGLIFLAASIFIFFRGIKRPPKPVSKQEIEIKHLEEEAILKHELGMPPLPRGEPPELPVEGLEREIPEAVEPRLEAERAQELQLGSGVIPGEAERAEEKRLITERALESKTPSTFFQSREKLEGAVEL